MIQAHSKVQWATTGKIRSITGMLKVDELAGWALECRNAILTELGSLESCAVGKFDVQNAPSEFIPKHNDGRTKCNDYCLLEEIRFYSNQSIRTLQWKVKGSSNPVWFRGFLCETRSKIEFYPSGKIQSLTLGDKQRIKGKTYPKGTRLELDESGRVIGSSRGR